ncbi:MAG: NAD-dependent DNA ligase LigA [Anaerovoracaceae bacterium]
MKDKQKSMKEKVDFLNKAAKAYYQESREIIPNLEYDEEYDKLMALEKETGIVMSNSPTANVGYQVLSDLPKEAHASPMLSLDKTKDVDQLRAWLGEEKGLLSWKIDGLTVVLTYKDGKLYKGITRGNGEIGEVITANARVFANLPVTIPFKGELTLRGEACIRYSDFEELNKTIVDMDAKYKNPRNLCSGTVRQLNNQITAERRVHFYVFALVEAEALKKPKREEELLWLKDQGFEVVHFVSVTKETLSKEVDWFAGKVSDNDIPSDGLVLIYDDIQYGENLGSTAKFPRDSIAFKWKDEAKETTLEDVEWSASRTGLINPVAIFHPVDLEGTTVSRASLHNVSILRELNLGIGDRITVYKANMIIPQVAENLTKSGNLKIPDRCPVCGKATQIKKEKDVEVLYCPNSECLAKQLKSFTHFVSRNAINLEGLSQATIEKLIAKGFVTEFADLFTIDKYSEEIASIDGFGEKSAINMIEAAKKAKNTTPARLLYGLGIPNIGATNAKVIAKACKNDWTKMESLTAEELEAIDGIGSIMAKAYVKFFQEEKNKKNVKDLLRVLTLDQSFAESEDQPFIGKTFVITGSLNHYKSRDTLKTLIEKSGGKVAAAVSKKTNYLINNDNQSSSSKNKKAMSLEIPIITEEDFIAMLKTGDGENA